MRTILNVDESEQSLTFAGDVPEGSLARLMRANFDRLVTAAGDAASLALRPGDGSTPAGPSLCLAVSCVGLRLVRDGGPGAVPAGALARDLLTGDAIPLRRSAARFRDPDLRGGL